MFSKPKGLALSECPFNQVAQSGNYLQIIAKEPV
jgi:hypothetical protein